MPDSDDPLNEEEIFQNAAALPASERVAYLRTACAGHPEVLASVERLLASVEDDGFMGKPLERTTSPELEAEFARLKPEEAGDVIGHYKLLQQIGEGGFGIVWMAEQEKPVRRRVALKIIKLGMNTKEVIARFEQERQALAIMEHPNIARVLDAGATQWGRPYFVMELVRGVKITEYCDQAKLSTADRLQLFITVCHAVQHAHQKGIIHRDIKPSNILVTLHDGVPVPKVIDFGVAKATQQQRLTDLTLFTQFEQMVGTPLYMSPEQAELSGLDIDTRSDIYSLGVLLYELLTGRTPFDPESLMRAGLDEIRRVIREEEPQKPSTFVSTMAVDLRTNVAQHRQADSAKLIGQIRGDLDWIVMKALEKDRNRRYDTANGLAKDIERHLASEPVQARPPTQLYRFRRLVRRNKVAFVAASAVLMALLIGLVVSTWMFLQEQRARRRAVAAEKVQDQQRQKAEQVALFLQKMLEGVGPSVALGRDTTMLREILDKTAEQVGKDLKDQPEVEAALRNVIGRVYHSLGELGKGETMLREALAIRKKHLGPEHPDIAASLCEVGYALAQQNRGHEVEAEATLREALAMQRKLFGPESLPLAKTLNAISRVLSQKGRPTEAETLAREALAMNRKLLGNDHENVAESLQILAHAVGRGEESSALSREVLAIYRKVHGNEHPETALALVNVSEDLAEAEIAARDSLMVQRKVLGVAHPAIADSLSTLGEVLQRQGKPEAAEALYREALAMDLKVGGIGFPKSVFSLLTLAGFLAADGRLPEAEVLLQEHLVMAREKLGGEHVSVAGILEGLGKFAGGTGRLPEAEALLREALHIRRKTPTVRLVELLDLLCDVLERQGKFDEIDRLQGEALAAARSLKDPMPLDYHLWKRPENLYRQRRYAEAEPLFRELVESRRSRLGAEHKETMIAMGSLARLLTDWVWADWAQVTASGERSVAANMQILHERAQEADKLLRQIVTTQFFPGTRRNPGESWRTDDYRGRLGGAMAAVAVTDQDLAPEARDTRLAEAERLLLNHQEALKSSAEIASKYKRDALTRLVRLYEAWKKPAEAAKWQKELADFDQAGAENLKPQSATPQKTR